MTSPTTSTRKESRTATNVPEPPEWEIERLDLDAYLSRIGYRGPLEPTVEVLTALHRAHAGTIPFENLGVVLGHGVSLDLDDIQSKLVRSRRGGYCFEHNLLFSAVLERIGFRVDRLVARVNPDRSGPRTHMTLNVEIDGETWLADVGFGAALLEPIRRVDGAESPQGKWTNGVRRDEAGLWRLRTREGNGWNDLYAFTEEPQRPHDYRVYNHYTTTHPRSPFVGQVVAIRITPEERYALRDAELAIVRPNAPESRRQVPIEKIPKVLHDIFGIALEPGDTATLTDFFTRANA